MGCWCWGPPCACLRANSLARQGRFHLILHCIVSQVWTKLGLFVVTQQRHAESRKVELRHVQRRMHAVEKKSFAKLNQMIGANPVEPI